MTKEEEKTLLQECIYESMNMAQYEMELLSSKCLTLNPSSPEFIELSSQFNGYFSMKIWLYNNLSCETIEDFHKRLLAFRDILRDNRNLTIEKYVEAAYYAEKESFDTEKCKMAFEKCDISLDSLSVLQMKEKGTELFQKAFRMIGELLKDKDIIKKEEECHFQLYTGSPREDWSAVGYYQVIKANHACYHNLEVLYDTVTKKTTTSHTIR